MAKKVKFYTVWQGKKPGVYESWSDCKAAISGFKGAQYKSFSTFAEAKKAYNGNYEDYKGKTTKKAALTEAQLLKIGEPNLYSIAVDAASSGNPGKMEYRGVDTQTKKELFKQGPFEQGTNNIGEFLALVHGLAYLKKQKNKTIFDLVERAIVWLNTNSYTTTIVKWETKAWGEIPADFGRK